MVSRFDPALEDAMQRAGHLERISLELLSDWRVFLTDVAAPRNSRWAKFSGHNCEDGDEAEEALESFIDSMYYLGMQSPFDDPDTEIAQALRLLVEVESLLSIIAGEEESAIVRETFSAAMMNLAAIMRRRGFDMRLPRVNLR